MKYIDLEFLPFKINKKYNKAIKEINCDEKIKLFGKYEAKVNLHRNLFNKTEAIFYIEELDIVDKLNNVLIDYYGLPHYIASNRLNVWKINDIYIMHGLPATRLDEEIHVISVSVVSPPGLYDYNSYKNILEIHERVKTAFNLKKATCLSVDLFSKISFWYESINYVYLISIDKKSVRITIVLKAGNTHSSQKQIKYIYKNSSEIYDIIYSFFKSRIVYDTSLYK